MYKKNEKIAKNLLFTDIINPAKSGIELWETGILFYLTMKDIINISYLNNAFNKKLTEEIKRRRNCVTIYTWFGNEFPIETYQDNGSGTRGRMGHSALQTYGSSSGESGIYASFYQGDCHIAKRIPSCRKSISHFHTKNQEMNKANKSTVTSVDLFGLDVEAIHQAFHELHDDAMNSRKEWSPRNNCSDVVLFLLQKGGLFEKINYNPFGFLSIGIISTISGDIFRATMESLWTFRIFYSLFRLQNLKSIAIKENDYLKVNELDILLDEISRRPVSLIRSLTSSRMISFMVITIYKYTPDFIKKRIRIPAYIDGIHASSELFIEGLLDVSGSLLGMQTISRLILTNKYHLPDTGQIIKNNTIIGGTISLLRPIVIHCVSNFFSEPIRKMVVHLFSRNHFYSFLEYPSLIWMNFSHSVLNNKNTFLLGCLGVLPSALILGIFLSGHFVYDTTTTPKHVYNIATYANPLLNGGVQNKSELGYSNNQTSNFFKKKSEFIDENKYTFLAVGGLVALGLFASRYSNNISGIVDDLVQSFNSSI